MSRSLVILVVVHKACCLGLHVGMLKDLTGCLAEPHADLAHRAHGEQEHAVQRKVAVPQLCVVK